MVLTSSGASLILVFEHKGFDFSFKVVPHVTDAIQEWIERVANVHVDGKEGPPDVCVIELGATIGTLCLLIFPFRRVAFC